MGITMYYVPQFASPYPDRPVRVASVAYRESLVLLRLLSAATRWVDGEEEKAKFIVAADYRITWTDGQGRQHDIVVPRGMLTDLASVPPVFRGLVSRTGPWLEAAVVHDFLTVAWITLDGDGSRLRRRFADDIMLAAMAAAQVAAPRRRLIYGAIRAAGWWTYPRRPDPGSFPGLYEDLSSARVLAELPPGVVLPAPAEVRIA